MFWRRVAGCSVLMLVLLAACTGAPAQQRGAAPSTLPEPSLELQSTVQIALVAAQTESPAAGTGRRAREQFTYDEGLGTAVQVGSRRLIITHGHWCQLDGHLRHIEIRDYRGDVLTYLEPHIFRNLMIYQDSGTLAFLAPETVPMHTELGPPQALRSGDQVQIVMREAPAGPPRVAEGTVISIPEGAQPAAFRLRCSNTPPDAGGSSGAGVWRDGQLLGNLWAVVEEQPLYEAGSSRCTPRATNVAIAASLPPLRFLQH